MVYIEDSVFEGLCKPWQDALVVKLLDKHIGYNIMKDKLSRIWKLKVGFDMIDIGNDFFVVKLNLDEDRKKIIENGPWMIFDHYLIIQTWTLAFVSPSTMIDPTMTEFPVLFSLEDQAQLSLSHFSRDCQTHPIPCKETKVVSQPSQAAEVTREATTNTGKTQYSSPLNENPVTEGSSSSFVFCVYNDKLLLPRFEIWFPSPPQVLASSID
ncbi:hypothetical protein D0Y65_004114 [Glycine soja]|uniref:DUF4283 domain-containing protein n=1 Tax=Glycine soja TaxID=3848 RepID=A0A445LPV0_GLYSO|nr:hypothetical protein D0Y65_004114 [Glycine soja]